MMVAPTFGGVSPLGMRKPRPLQPPTTPATGAMPPLQIGDVGGPPPMQLGTMAPVAPTPTPMPMSGVSPLGPAPVAPAGYAQTSAYGPGADLRGTQILPGASAATTAANTAATSALGNYAGFQATPFSAIGTPGAYSAAADTTGTRGLLTNALAQLANGPDRGQLASQNFNLLDQTAREASARDQRTIGQSASKFGRIGSGITTTNLGDLGERQAIDRSRAQTQMSLDAAGQTMADRLAAASGIGAGFNTLNSADLGTAGFNQGLRGEARGERSAALDANNQDFSRRSQLFGDVANYAGNQSTLDANNRAEMRGERGFQTGQEQTAYDRNRQAIGDANAQSNNALNQALTLIGAGSGTNLTGLLSTQGAQQSAAGAGGIGDIASLLAQWYASRKAA